MYHNPFAAGYEVLAKTGFTASSHGSIESTASYLFTNDVPDYAVMFYHPTEHEQFSQIKYGSFEAGYHGLAEVREDLLGMPMEFYIPKHSVVETGVGRRDEVKVIPEKLVEVLEKETANEIQKAQDQIKQSTKHTKRITIEKEETLVLKRKRKITFETR